MQKKTWLDIICGLLILLFLYAAISKLLDFRHFRTVLFQSPLIHSYALPVAWLIPLTEIGIGALLFFPATRGIGLTTSCLLLLLFTIYIIYMLFFVPHLPCSCGGVLQRLTWKQHCYFNLFFLVLSAIGLHLHHRLSKTPSGWSAQVPYPSRKDIV